MDSLKVSDFTTVRHFLLEGGSYFSAIIDKNNKTLKYVTANMDNRVSPLRATRRQVRTGWRFTRSS
jgi:hypothetical protein